MTYYGFFSDLYYKRFRTTYKTEADFEYFASYFEIILKHRFKFDHTSKADRKRFYKFMDELDDGIKERLLSLMIEYGFRYNAICSVDDIVCGGSELSLYDLQNFLDDFYWSKIRALLQ